MSKLITLCLVLSICACNDGNRLRPGSPARNIPVGSNASAIIVRGIRVVPPVWFKSGDHDALKVAIDEYLTDFRSSINWTPSPATATRFNLTIFFHDVYGQNYFNSGTRTAHLQWPRGSAGKPLKSRFCPLFHNVLVLDRRRELNISGPLTPTETSTIDRGITLPVTLRTRFASTFE